MMYLQHKLFGTNRFLINDARLIDEKYPASKVVVQFSETGLKKDDGSQQALSDYVEVEICTTIELVTCPHHPGQLCGDYNNNGLYTVTRCQSYWIWAYGGGTGGGGSSEDPEGGGGGGGSSGGSASVSLLYHLEQTLGLSYEEKNTIAPYGTLCEEIYNHLNYNNSLETADERKAMALSHVKYLHESGYYLNFATTFSSHNESLENFPLPWFHFNNLDQTNPALYENIYHLKLRAKQAYYLLNNPVRSEEIYNNSQVSVLPIDIRYSRIKFHIDKLMTNPSYVAFISNYAATNNGNIMWWESPIFNTGNNVDWNFWIDTNAEIPSNANGSENYEYIQNIEDYLKCFNDGKTASSYELKIYIDDPAGDGAFQPDYIKKGIKDAGHTFVEVIKNNTDGTKVSQLIGFYPDPNNLPNLQSTSTISKLKNDSNHEFDSKIEIYITVANFNTVLDQIRNYSTAAYDFETFNCTSFAQQVSSSIGINLPSGYRTFGERGGRTYSGVCPSGLQEDIFNWPNKPANVHNVQKYNISKNAPIGKGKCP